MESTNEALKLISQAIEILKNKSIIEPPVLTAIDLLLQSVDKLAKDK